MRKKWLNGGLALVTVLVIAYLGLSSANKDTQSESIKIGLIGPLSGQNAQIGVGIRNGAQLAASKAAGVELVFEDDQFETQKGVSAFLKLRDVDRVKAIINVAPGTSDAIEPLIRNGAIPVVQIAEPGITKNDTIFQIMPSGKSIYGELGRLAKERYSSIAFVYEQNATFEKAMRAFRENYEDSAHSFFPYPLGENSDHGTLILRLLQDKPAAYTIASSPNKGVLFVKKVSELPPDKQMKVLCNPDMEVTISDYLKAVSSSYFSGCYSVFFKSEASEAFKKEYKTAYGIDPGFASDYAYDAVSLLKATYSKDKDKWIKNLSNANIQGVSGLIDFDNEGVRRPRFEVHVFRDKSFVKE